MSSTVSIGRAIQKVSLISPMSAVGFEGLSCMGVGRVYGSQPDVIYISSCLPETLTPLSYSFHLLIFFRPLLKRCRGCSQGPILSLESMSREGWMGPRLHPLHLFFTPLWRACFALGEGREGVLRQKLFREGVG